MYDETLKERVAAVETEVENIKSTLMEIKEATVGMKTKLDQQNGKIPHMYDKINEISTDLKNLSDLSMKQQIEDTKAHLLIKILWGATSAVVLALVGAFLNYIF